MNGVSSAAGLCSSVAGLLLPSSGKKEKKTKMICPVQKRKKKNLNRHDSTRAHRARRPAVALRDDGLFGEQQDVRQPEAIYFP